jgi:hypothetical protein
VYLKQATATNFSSPLAIWALQPSTFFAPSAPWRAMQLRQR